MSSELLTPQQLTGLEQSHLRLFAPNRLLHQQVIPAFTQLQKAAQQAGFTLFIASAFRSFERQLQIWNNKYSGITPILDQDENPIDINLITEKEKLYKLLHWSALPSTSRHHWGTDIDIYEPTRLPTGQQLQLQVSEYTNDGYFTELSQWLDENALHFGFYKPYQNQTNGVAQEPWHLSYFPLADKYLAQLDLDLISDTLKAHSIQGKSLILQELPNIYRQYVCNISPR